MSNFWVALSGGGLRSCAYSVGALNYLSGLDSVTIERLSSVSGGGYAGGSFLISLMEANFSSSGFKKRGQKLNRILVTNLFLCAIVLLLALPVCLSDNLVVHSIQMAQLGWSPFANESIANMNPLPGLGQGILGVCAILICVSFVYLLYFLVQPIIDLLLTPCDALVSMDFKSEKIDQQKVWQSQIAKNFGYLVNIDAYSFECSNFFTVTKCCICFVAQMWGVFFDVVLLIACLFAFPLLFFLGILYPGGMIIAVLAVQFPSVNLVWSIKSLPRCYFLFPVWTRNSSIEGSIEVASASPLVFSVPFFTVSLLLVMDFLRLLLEYICLKIFKSPLSQTYSRGLFFHELFKQVLVLVLIIVGWVLSIFKSESMWCSGLNDMEAIFEGLIAIGICFSAMFLKRGGIVFSSVVLSSFAFFVVMALGPPQFESELDWVEFTGNDNNSIDADAFGTIFIPSVRFGWNFLIFMAGTILLCFPTLVSGKRLIMHRYYRFCLSRAYIPPLSDGWLGNLDYFVIYVLRIPFSFRTFELFPYNHSTFQDLHEFQTLFPGQVPSLDIQMSVHLWNENLEGSVFPDGITSRVIFSANANENPPIFFKKPSENEIPVSCGHMEIMVAVAVSGAAIGAHLGSQFSSSVPSSLISFIGGGCARWVRMESTKTFDCNYVFTFGVNLTMMVLGILIMIGGALCVPSQSFVPGVSPCQDSDILIWQTCLATLAFLAVCFLSILAIPHFSNWIYSSKISSPLFSGLFATLSISYFGSKPPAKFLGSDGGFTENMALLPLLYHAVNSKEGLSDTHIVVMSGESLERGELVSLIPAVVLAKSFFNLDCRIVGGARRLKKFASEKSLHSLSGFELEVLYSICSDLSSNATLDSLVNFSEYLRRSDTLGCFENNSEVQEVEWKPCDLLPLVFSLGEKQVSMFLSRPRAPLNHEQELFGFFTSSRVVRLSRFMVVVLFFTLEALVYGLLVEILLIPLVKASNLETEVTNAGVTFSLFGYALAILILVVGLVKNKGIQINFLSLLGLLGPPVIQFLVTLIISSNCVNVQDGGFVTQQCSETNPTSYFFSHFYTVYTLFGASFGIIFGLNMFSLLQLAAGKFPNHSTPVMQAISDSSVFEMYSKAGERSIIACVKEVKVEKIVKTALEMIDVNRSDTRKLLQDMFRDLLRVALKDEALCCLSSNCEVSDVLMRDLQNLLHNCLNSQVSIEFREEIQIFLADIEIKQNSGTTSDCFIQNVFQVEFPQALLKVLRHNNGVNNNTIVQCG